MSETTAATSDGSVDPVAESPEARATLPGGVELCYQTFGDPLDEPLLLVMGVGCSMLTWDRAFCAMLARAGFFVIRYDNRDTGHSTWFPTGDADFPVLARAFLGAGVSAPYSLDDLAADAVGLLDHLGIASAHLVGASMGGMIVQTAALAHPERVRSLTSIMSTTGRRSVGWQDPRLLPRLVRPHPATEDEYVTANAELQQVLGSPGHPVDLDTRRRRARAAWARGINPTGGRHHMLAVLTQRDRTRELARLTVPALVIHGMADRMVHVSGGMATARALPGASLLLIPGMGHDVPAPLFSQIAEGIRALANVSARAGADVTGDVAAVA